MKRAPKLRSIVGGEVALSGAGWVVLPELETLIFCLSKKKFAPDHLCAKAGDPLLIKVLRKLLSFFP